MKIYTFGAEDAPVLLLLPGTCCHWKSNFGAVIPLLADSFRVLCVSYDGFDETEQTEFSTMLDLQAQMMLLLAIGVFLAKKKLITDQGRACLTDLLLFIIQPANIIQSFRIEFNAEIFRSTRDILILSILLQVLYGVVHADAAPDSPQRKVYDWLDTDEGRRCIEKAGYVTLSVTPQA